MTQIRNALRRKANDSGTLFKDRCSAHMNPELGKRLIMIGLALTVVLLVIIAVFWLTGSPPDTVGNNPA